MTLKRVQEIDVSLDAESSDEIALIRNSMGMLNSFLSSYPSEIICFVFHDCT